MIHVIALITAKPGQRARILDAFHANTAAVRAEAGCIEYAAAVDAAGMPTSRSSLGPDTFVVVEKWDSLEALKHHSSSPHMLAYAAQTRELTEHRVIHVMDSV